MMTERVAKSTVPGGDYLEMYRLLHEERVSLADEARKLEMAAITAVAALYAWLATHDVHGAPWYIGVPLVILAAFRAIVLGERILFIKKYLMLIEHKLFRDGVGLSGYENYFHVHTKNKF